MNTVPTKRDNAGDEKARNLPDETDDREDDDLPWARGGPSLKAALDEAKAEGERPGSASRDSALRPVEKTVLPNESVASPQEELSHAPPPDASLNDGVEGGAEDMSMDLDEDDYQAAERKYKRDLQMLEASRPPTPRHHPELLALLEECDALASAAEDLANGILPNLSAEPRPAPIPVSGLPSPKVEDSEKMDMDADTSYDAVLAVNRRPTPPVETLPFLVSGPPTPFSQIDDLQPDVDFQELVRSRLLDHLTAQGEQMAIQYGRIKSEYAKLYRSWREKNLPLEEREKARNDAEPPPAPIEAAPTVAGSMTSISGVRSRAVRNASDLQMEAAMELSRQTAVAEEEKRSHLVAG